jgi:Pentapeptide repeats (8 copies)
MPNDVPRPAAPKPDAGGETPSPARIDWRCVNLRGASMAGISLEHADMRAADLRGVDFSGSNLRYADLRGASVQGANFQNATLYGAKMQGAEAHGADFRNCDLRQVNFGGAYTDGALMPPLSPGDIGDGLALQEKPWNQRLEEDRKGNEDGNTGGGQNEQARARSLPNEQKDRGPGRKR